MAHYGAPIREYLDELTRVIDALDPGEIDAVAHVFREAYDHQRTIFVLGNGGSAATASHYACDLNKGACFKAEKKFRVHALTDNLATILAVGNDLDYESIFVEQLKNFCRPGDVVVGISGSGNSPNVLRAIEYANRLGCTTVGLCGYDGGKLKPLVRLAVHVRADDMQIVEDIHLIVGHVLMRVVGGELGALG
jgi:D-sedoheptulose 7-phosphate isomerase